MPFDGAGNFVRLYSWTTDASNGVNITASRFDSEDSGFATGLSNCLTRDGQGTPTANLPMNGHQHTGVAAATGAGQYTEYAQMNAAIAARTTTLDLFVTIGDGVNVIPTGVAANWFELDFAGTITQWTVLANASGSVSIDVWKCTYAQFDAGATHPVAADKISATSPITFSSATKGQDSTLAGWTTAFNVGDVLAFNVSSAATCKQVTISLRVTKTG